jgi:ribosome recycling factor
MDDFVTGSKSIIDRFADQLRQVRTGRAQPSLVENYPIQVDAYGGARMALKELASITAADSTLLVIQPFDKSVLKDVERSLSLVASEIGSSPIVKDNLIHIIIPALTQERRLQLVKLVKEKLEDTKVSLRNLRTDVKEMIESDEGTAGISEDDIKREVENLQKQVEAATDTVTQMAAKKEQELLQL